MPQCGYMEYGLKDTAFYVQKHTNTLHSCHNFPVGSRQAARGARICETSLLRYLFEHEHMTTSFSFPVTRFKVKLHISKLHIDIFV